VRVENAASTASQWAALGLEKLHTTGHATMTGWNAMHVRKDDKNQQDTGALFGGCTPSTDRC
jgi:hypothetical protein